MNILGKLIFICVIVGYIQTTVAQTEANLICDEDWYLNVQPNEVTTEIERLNALNPDFDINQICNEATGDQPIHIAVMRTRNLLVIDALLEAGADVLQANLLGETPTLLVERMHSRARLLLEQIDASLLPNMEDYLAERIQETSQKFDTIRQQLQDIMREFIQGSFEDETADTVNQLQESFESTMEEFRNQYRQAQLQYGMQAFQQSDRYTNWSAIQEEYDFLERLLEYIRGRAAEATRRQLNDQLNRQSIFLDPQIKELTLEEDWGLKPQAKTPILYRD